MANKTLEENVVQNGWVGRVIEKPDGDKVFLKGKQLPPGEKATPSSFAEEQTASSPLGDLRSTLRAAMTEAGQRRGQQFGEALDAGLGEGDFRTLGGTLKNIRQMTMQPAEEMFSDVMAGVTEERRQSMALLETFASDGTLGNLGDNALMEMAQRTGMDEDTLRGWRARVKQTTEMSDEMARLEIERIKAQIQQSRAAAAASGRSGIGPGIGDDPSGILTSIMQNAISSGLTPEEAATAATRWAIENEIGVDRNALLAQAKGMMPQAGTDSGGNTGSTNRSGTFVEGVAIFGENLIDVGRGLGGQLGKERQALEGLFRE